MSTPEPLPPFRRHSLSPLPLPRAHLPLDSVGMAQCHVTAFEMYRKRRCTNNATIHLYSPLAPPACTTIQLLCIVLMLAYLIRTLLRNRYDAFSRSATVSRNIQRFHFERKIGHVDVISKFNRIINSYVSLACWQCSPKLMNASVFSLSERTVKDFIRGTLFVQFINRKRREIAHNSN